MFSSFRIGSLILSGITISSMLLFPEAKEVNHYPNVRSLSNLEKSLDELKKTEPSALSVWRQFQAMLMEEFSTINYETVSDEEMKILFDKIKNLAMPILKSVMTEGAKNLTNLSPYERYLLNSMVQSSLKIVKKGSIAYKFMKHLGSKLDKFEKTPFEYISGRAQSQSCHGNVKIFSWNTCLLPGKLPKVFSGLAPWYERLELILEQVKSQNADVICLQEVHSEPAASAIYHALKDHYAHFYVNMGPKIMGSQVSDIGLNSGLFVASKFPLSDIHFEAFHSEEGQKNVNKGFFWAQIENTDVGFATCHLEPFNEDHSKRVRFEELNYLVEFLASKNIQVRLLSGDLNIPWGSGEQAESLIKNHFFDPYNKNRVSVSKHSRTFSDVFMSKHQDGSCDILDYFLIFQVPGFEKYAFLTERVEGFDELKLETKGSDHHGLYSQVIFPFYQK